MRPDSPSIDGESEDDMTTSTAYPSLSTMTFDEALEALIRFRELTPSITEALGLKMEAVRNWMHLPEMTRESMIDALIDRLDK